MNIEVLQQWIDQNFWFVLPLTLLAAYFIYRGTRYLLARGAYRFALHTENIYDDLIVDRLQPFRMAWLLPLGLIYFFTVSLALPYPVIRIGSLVLIIWFLVDLIIAILNGINDVYKHNPRYTGVSVAGYIGLIKVLIVFAGFALSVSLSFEVEPLTLLTGLGAWFAIIMLIFQDTIVSFMASVQISTQKLVKEGDMVDIPAFNAGGTITNIDLQTITVQNFDNTITYIPTSKIVGVGLKNYRTMIESGARRLKKSILLDADSIEFCNEDILNSLGEVDFLEQFKADILENLSTQTTNLQLYMQYIQDYLKTHKEIRQRRYPFIVRVMEPTSTGIPLEIYVFVKAPTWEKFEELQSEVLIHLMAVLPHFKLKVFQLAQLRQSNPGT